MTGTRTDKRGYPAADDNLASVGHHENKPLASFCLKSYNQKQYLVEALKGAFAQTYRPLEIVISDDGSTDGSWEYIQNEVTKFQSIHGNDISFVLNRNETNIGNLGNWQNAANCHLVNC